MGICRKCRFWTEDILSYKQKLGYGECSVVACESPPTKEGYLAVVNLISETGFAELLTKADFGCVLFEEKK